VRAGILPRPKNNDYDGKACLKAYLRYLREKPSALTEERSRLVRAKADLAELERGQLSGELINAEEARTIVFSLARYARDSILSLPDRVAPILAAETDSHKVYMILLCFREMRRDREAIEKLIDRGI